RPETSEVRAPTALFPRCRVTLRSTPAHPTQPPRHPAHPADGGRGGRGWGMARSGPTGAPIASPVVRSPREVQRRDVCMNSPELTVAEEAARAGGAILTRYFREGVAMR